MKILFVNYEYPPLGGGGGGGMKEICEELARTHEVHVLTSGAVGLEAVDRHATLNLTVHRVFVKGRKARATASFVSMFDFLPSGIKLGNKLIKEHQFDVINTWFAIPSGITGGWIARKNKVPHLLTVIGGDIYDPSKWYSPHSWLPSKLGVKWALKRGDKFVAISTDIARRTKEYFNFNKNIDVISLGIQEPEFTPVTRAELGMDPDKKYIVTVGRQVRRKDYPTLLRAVSQLSRTDIDLIMIGDGPEQENLQALAEELGISDRVQFRGFVSYEVKYQVLANSDLFILASLHEGFGVVYLEAMYCGLPIIAADIGGQVDLLEEGLSGHLVRIGDVDQMSVAIDSVFSSSEQAAKMGEHNIRHVQNFAISRLAAQYEEQLKPLCK